MSRLSDDKLRSRAYTALREMAHDGIMPSTTQWNSKRPFGLPTYSALTYRLGLNNWTEVAEWAGLEMGSNRAGRKAVQEERLAPVVTATAPQPGMALVEYDEVLDGYGLQIVRRRVEVWNILERRADGTALCRVREYSEVR